MVIRKLLAVLVVFASLQTAQCQIAKGTIMAGGSVGFQFTTNHELYAKDFTFHFTPLLGGFIAKNVVLGVAPLAAYSTHSVVTPNNIRVKDNVLSLGLGPYVRYYVNISSKAYFFVHGSPSVMASWDSYITSSSTTTTKTVSANWTLGPGFSVFVTKAIAVEASLYYNGMWHQSSQYNKGNLISEGNKYVDHGMLLNVGMQVYFERNKKAKTTTP
ncbi:MAG: hypothetical protein JST90_15105 [Bacteroidetes bacterium]|nr:hypothetical protein [Bacteroidota bacterium]